MKKKSSLELYHYIDEGGLDSLYAQCGQFLVESLTKMEKAGEIDANVEVEIGKLLSMLGIGGAKIEGEISLNRLKSESLKTIFRVEQRIPLILDYLRTEGNIREFALADVATIKEDGYVLIEGEFQTPDFQEVLEKSKVDPMQIMFAALVGDKDKLKLQGFVQFVSHTAVGRITMGTSLAKYKTGLQHLMIMWRSSGGDPRQVRLCVFGYLTRKGEGEYYLKPFTVAQAK